MSLRTPFALAIFISALFSGPALSQSSCSATNDNGDATCSISCPVGQSAECRNGTGSSSPECGCSGESQLDSIFIPRPDSAGTLAFAPSSLEHTNVLQSINAKLAGLRNYALRQTCSREQVGRECVGEPCVLSSPAVAPSIRGPQLLCRSPRICYDTFETVCRNVNGKLTSSPSFTIEKPPSVVVEEPNWKDIPTEVLGYRETYINCTSLKQSISFRHGETVRTGRKASKTKAIATNDRIDVKVEYKLAKDLGPSIGGGYSYSKTVTITDLNEESEEETRPLEKVIPLDIASGTQVVMDHQWIRREVPILFNGRVTLDSAIEKNLEGIHRASQVLTNTADRTFEFSGVIQHNLLLEGKTRVVETKMTEDECKANPGFHHTSEPYSEISL